MQEKNEHLLLIMENLIRSGMNAPMRSSPNAGYQILR